MWGLPISASMYVTPNALQEKKKFLRQEMLAKRSGILDKEAAALKLADIFMRGHHLEKGAIIGSYYAFRGEMDPLPLTDILRSHGHSLALPVIAGANLPLIFRQHEKDALLVPNSLGIPEPNATCPVVEPDILLVPLLAFDRARHRLGYGGGYYDRTIASLRSRKFVQVFGIAYSLQEVAEIPATPNDVKMDAIVTELGLF